MCWQEEAFVVQRRKMKVKKKKKKTFTRPVAFQNEPSGCSSKLAEKVRGEIFDFVSFPESYIILQVCSDGTTRWLSQGSGI
ncbi:hypothetical protein QG37_00372 [Candidozyma auris]|nr:hypothetical protein QG37_00372 [[Candida] auris]